MAGSVSLAGSGWAGGVGNLLGVFGPGWVWSRPSAHLSRLLRLLCQLLSLLSRHKTGIIDAIKYTCSPRRSAWWAGPPPLHLAMLLGPDTGVPVGGMPAGSRPQDPGKETLVLGPGGWPPTLPPGCRLVEGRGQSWGLTPNSLCGPFLTLSVFIRWTRWCSRSASLGIMGVCSVALLSLSQLPQAWA